MNINFSEGEVSIWGINEKTVMIDCWVTSIEVLKQVLIFKIEEKDNNTMKMTSLNQSSMNQKKVSTEQRFRASSAQI